MSVVPLGQSLFSHIIFPYFISEYFSGTSKPIRFTHFSMFKKITFNDPFLQKNFRTFVLKIPAVLNSYFSGNYCIRQFNFTSAFSALPLVRYSSFHIYEPNNHKVLLALFSEENIHVVIWKKKFSPLFWILLLDLFQNSRALLHVL